MKRNLALNPCLPNLRGPTLKGLFEFDNLASPARSRARLTSVTMDPVLANELLTEATSAGLARVQGSPFLKRMKWKKEASSESRKGAPPPPVPLLTGQLTPEQNALVSGVVSLATVALGAGYWHLGDIHIHPALAANVADPVHVAPPIFELDLATM